MYVLVVMVAIKPGLEQNNYFVVLSPWLGRKTRALKQIIPVPVQKKSEPGIKNKTLFRNRQLSS
jgi:hypothetical protein